jgi:hypothetical protein
MKRVAGAKVPKNFNFFGQTHIREIIASYQLLTLCLKAFKTLEDQILGRDVRNPVAPFALCPVERLVGAFQKLVDLVVGARKR